MHTGPTQFVMQHLRHSVRGDEPTDGELLDSFLCDRDDVAFAALLRRHGPMVWGVCRRLAGHLHDAEDAFQAVFLILVRRATTVRPRDRVGAWLHGVAVRTARKARQRADRRHAQEKQVAVAPQRAIEPPVLDADLRPVIDEELQRLPVRLRLPVLLCDLEGRPRREVARQLGVPVGTLGHRLDAARKRLAARLSRRGVTLALGGLAVAVPRSLASITCRATTGLAAGRSLASLVQSQIVALMEGTLNMNPIRFRLAAVLTLLAAVGGFGLHAVQRPAAGAAEHEPAKPAKKAAEPAIDDATFLRRISLDLRGTIPTKLEMAYFVADNDAGKRRKVVAWMIEPVPTWKDKVSPTDNQGRESGGARPSILVDSSPSETVDSENLRKRWSYFEPQSDRPPLDSFYRRAVEGQSTAQQKQIDVARSLFQGITDPKPDDATVRMAIEYLLRTQPDGTGALQGTYDFRPSLSKDSSTAGWLEYLQITLTAGSEADFLKRVIKDLTGTPATNVELHYFINDKDPRKREKVVALLLKDPSAVKRLEFWRTAATAGSARTRSTVVSGRIDKLLTELLDGNRKDEQILEALTLATLARFPTDTERQFVATQVDGKQDRRAAWTEVLSVLMSTREHRAYVESLIRK